MKMNYIYRTLLVWIIVLGSVVSAFAQRPTGPQIRQLKIEFVTERINLNATQQKQFLPLYNEYSDELHKVRIKRRALNDPKNSLDPIAEREKLDREVVNIKRKFNARFLKIIDSNQLNKLHKAEEDFRQMLMKQLGNN